MVSGSVSNHENVPPQRLARLPQISRYRMRKALTNARVWLQSLGVLFAVGASWAAGHLSAEERPRLIVVMAVDQLSYEFLIRFRDRFQAGGFFHLAERQAAWFTECHHRHGYTVTGPGHSVIMTGTYPYRNGIIDNEWFDQRLRSKRYCVEDPSMPIVGAPYTKSEYVGVSPANLLVPTVGDAWRDATEGKGKVLGVTLKDRAAVLMSGIRPSGVYWFDVNTGKWVTSRYYRSELPRYMKEINAGDFVTGYAGKVWTPLYDADAYHPQHPDESPFEGETDGVSRAFPHRLPTELTAKFYKQLLISPFGNELTMRVVQLAIEAEELGMDDVPDILNVGLSSNDYVGHNYGPYSLEVEDMTYRTDKLLSEFVQYLDNRIGTGRWTMFLTADHGVTPIPEYVVTQGLPGKRKPLGDLAAFVERLEARLATRFGPPRTPQHFVAFMDAHQLFLDRRSFENLDAYIAARAVVRDFFLQSDSVAFVATRDELIAGRAKAQLADEYQPFLARDSQILKLLQRSFNADRSGDVIYAYKPYQIQSTHPASHGSPWTMDSHVPLIVLGCGIKPAKCDRPTSPAAVASTVAKLLGIDPPSANEEQPLQEALAW